MITKIPKNLQAVLWSEDIKTLDVQKDKTYIFVSKFLLGFNQPPNEDKYLRSY